MLACSNPRARLQQSVVQQGNNRRAQAVPSSVGSALYKHKGADVPVTGGTISPQQGIQQYKPPASRNPTWGASCAGKAQDGRVAQNSMSTAMTPLRGRHQSPARHQTGQAASKPPKTHLRRSIIPLPLRRPRLQDPADVCRHPALQRAGQATPAQHRGQGAETSASAKQAPASCTWPEADTMAHVM